MSRPELALWLLLAVFLWILADVAPLYHHEHAEWTHHTYTAYGWVVVIVAGVSYIRRKDGTR